jgi:nitroreductase
VPASVAYDPGVDTFLAIASKRDTRRYADQAVPEEVLLRILEAGRVSGSARNRQPWRFLVVESADRREQLAGAVYEGENVRGAKVVVAIVSSGGLDTGRCMQNMMLAAWNDGVASCPNGIADADAARAALGLGGDDQLAVVLTFGYPAHGKTGASRSVEEWLERADRKPLDELVTRL